MGAAPSPRLPLQQSLPRRPGPVRPATAKPGQVVTFADPPLARPTGLKGPRGRSQPGPARVWPQDAWRAVILGEEAAAVSNPFLCKMKPTSAPNFIPVSGSEPKKQVLRSPL